jgi:exosome complex component RRP4
VLAGHFVPLSDTILLEAYEWAVDSEDGVKDLLQQDVADALIASVSSRS